jgi:predicted transcriptional regulator
LKQAIWSKRTDIISSLLYNGGTDSTTLKQRLSLLDSEFYPAVRSLIEEGLVDRKKDFFYGRDLYVKQFYYLTKKGMEYATEKQNQGIQI